MEKTIDKSQSANEIGNLYTYLKAIARIPTLSAAEESRLAARIRAGDKAALMRMVNANLRFVVKVARNYQNQGVALSDLINEGNLGLIRAAQRFDETKNFKFITYAVWWIRQAILKALADQSRIVKLPLNRVGTLYKIGKVQARLEQRFGRIPSTREIAGHLNIGEIEVADTIRAGNPAMSLDSPLDDDTEGVLLDRIHEKTQEMPDDNIAESSLNREIEKLLRSLDKREGQILRLYFGLGDETPCTLDEIGRRFKLTRERARQLKQRAILCLRHSSRRHNLHAYVR